MSDHYEPLTPTVLFVSDKERVWQHSRIWRLTPKYHTPTTVQCNPIPKAEDYTLRVRAGQSGIQKQQTAVYPIRDDAAWGEVIATHTALQQALDDLAVGLRELGSYASQLAAAGGLKKAPNPLCATVIECLDPDNDRARGEWHFADLVPRLQRQAIKRHTEKMLSNDATGGYVFSQNDRFVCPDNAAWRKIETLHQVAERAAKKWKELLKTGIGTYASATAKGRYPRAWPELPEGHNLFYGHHRGSTSYMHIWRPAPRDRAKNRHEPLCVTQPMQEMPARADLHAVNLVLCAECRKELAKLTPIEQPEQPAAAAAPTAPAPGASKLKTEEELLTAGWKWLTFHRQGSDFYCLKAPDLFKTKEYQHRERAIAEAGRYVLSQPKPKLAPQLPAPEHLDSVAAPLKVITFEPPALAGVVMMTRQEARACIDRIKASVDQVRKDLLALHDQEGWAALGYDSWRTCVTVEFGQSQSYLYRQLAAAELERDLGFAIGEIPEAHLRPLGQLDTTEEKRQALARADEIAGETPRQAKHVSQAVAEQRPPTLAPKPSKPGIEYLPTGSTIPVKVDGKGMLPAPAYARYGHLALTQGARPDARATITHIPTGMAIRDTPTITSGHLALEALAGLNWDFSRVEDMPTETVAKAKEINARLEADGVVLIPALGSPPAPLPIVPSLDQDRIAALAQRDHHYLRSFHRADGSEAHTLRTPIGQQNLSLAQIDNLIASLALALVKPPAPPGGDDPLTDAELVILAAAGYTLVDGGVSEMGPLYVAMRKNGVISHCTRNGWRLSIMDIQAEHPSVIADHPTTNTQRRTTDQPQRPRRPPGNAWSASDMLDYVGKLEAYADQVEILLEEARAAAAA